MDIYRVLSKKVFCFVLFCFNSILSIDVDISPGREVRMLSGAGAAI